MADLPADPAAFVQAWLDAFNRRDWESYAACFIEDVTYLTPGRTAPLVSRQAHVDHDVQHAGELRLEPTLLVSGQDERHVVVEGLALAPGRSSPWVTVLEFRSGRISAERLYFDRGSNSPT